MTATLVLLLLACALTPALSFHPFFCRKLRLVDSTHKTSSHYLSASIKWDMLIDEDEDEGLHFNGHPGPRDMKYNLLNIKRQRENFESIKAVSGKELINDVYARDSDTDVYWYVGKVARVSDVSIENAIARQWPMIEEHSVRLRPAELYPKWGTLELWAAPGDSEMDVAYCKPEIVFVQMFRDSKNSSEIRNKEVGFAGELYENGEEGFRTTRTADGKAVREIQSSVVQQQPTDKELDDMMEMLNSKVVMGSDE
ncbi:hypothetical protein ACHAW5_005930 [Stephanodiscus triporus]|uniref:Uncharacterized protein n=1 Tax=Stephanodiscus triporus TaxID=2934178 RepID=A0ABD3N6F3_9STRA